MATWKKVIVSGSNAELNEVTASFFSGDGSALTNVPAGSVNIESFTNGTSITVATSDKLLLSDAGTEKYINVSQLPFNNYSLPAATADEIGGVTVADGSGITLSEGAISVTNPFTDADETKLDGIETSADVTDATNVAAAGAIMDGDFTSNGFMKRTGAGTYTVDTSTYLTTLGSVTGHSDVSSAGSGAIITSAERTKLSGIATSANNYSLPAATADEIGGVTVADGSGITLSEGAISVTNPFTDADETKLDGIETSADVTDATNVAAAGAIMDGDFTSNGFMKRTGAGTYTVDTSTYLTTLGSVTGHSDVSSAGSGAIITSAERTKLSGIATNANNFTLGNATTEELGGVIVGSGLSVSEGTISVDSQTDNNFTNADHTKLDGIETSADVTDTANVKAALNASVGSMTIGDSNDTVTIAGNLTVSGTTTTVDTANLNVTDQFINLNDGGSAADGGIVIEGQGTAFGWDESENRWSFDFSGATEGQTAIASDAYAVAVVTTDDANYRKTGNIRVQSGEIYIYV